MDIVVVSLEGKALTWFQIFGDAYSGSGLTDLIHCFPNSFWPSLKILEMNY